MREECQEKPFLNTKGVLVGKKKIREKIITGFPTLFVGKPNHPRASKISSENPRKTREKMGKMVKLFGLKVPNKWEKKQGKMGNQGKWNNFLTNGTK